MASRRHDVSTSALQVPKMLEGITLAWLPILAVVIVATLLARLLVLFGFLPLLSRLRLSAPISASYTLAITWGELRGAVTLVGPGHSRRNGTARS